MAHVSGLDDLRRCLTRDTLANGREYYLETPPTVSVVVPTEDADDWVVQLRDYVGYLLAVDLAPLTSAPAPEHTTVRPIAAPIATRKVTP